MTKLIISSESANPEVRGQYRLTRHLRGLYRKFVQANRPGNFMDYIDAHALYGMARRVQAIRTHPGVATPGGITLLCVNACGQEFTLHLQARIVRVEKPLRTATPVRTLRPPVVLIVRKPTPQPAYVPGAWVARHWPTSPNAAFITDRWGVVPKTQVLQ